MQRQRIVRQPAFLMLASEFGTATLNEKGSGEFDPSFVITKLGSKANRVVVCGLLERLEIRETSNGATLYQGQLRDPTGLHYFSVGDYNSETMREMSSQWAGRTEEGEPILLMMTAKTRWYQTEEGAVYTSLRPEEACEVTRDVYANWLLDACESTMARMKAYTASLELEATLEAYERSDLPSGMKQGLLAARNHYDEVDLEPFNLNLMQALDIAEGKMAAATTPPPMVRLPDGDEPDAETGDGELRSFILHVVQHFDQGDGVDFNTIIKNAAARGYVREQAEAMLDELADTGDVDEPRFGWFRALGVKEE